MTTTKQQNALFAEGRQALEQHDFPKAVQLFKLILNDFKTCVDACNSIPNECSGAFSYTSFDSFCLL